MDVPGHERLRQKYIDHYKNSVRGIIYVIDSSNIQKQLRDTAEFLFNIISEPTLFAAKPQLLVACNKQDVGLAKGSGVIRRELQRELNLLRDTHSRSLQGTNDTPVVDHAFLGHEGQDFDFLDLPMKVTISSPAFKRVSKQLFFALRSISARLHATNQRTALTI